MAAIVRAVPGLASSGYTLSLADLPYWATGGATDYYYQGTPWFSTTTACGSTVNYAWIGIRCLASSSASSRRITALRIGQQSGVFPDAVFGLPDLTELQIYSNSISGFVPDLFGSLPSLSYLALGGNTGLVGTVPPSIGSLRSLTNLYLASIRERIATPFTGVLPAALCSLTTISPGNCSLSNTVACPLPSCSFVTMCSSGCATPSPPPPATRWTSVNASVTLGGYTAATFSATLQTAFIGVMTNILGKPASSMTIVSVSTASSGRRSLLGDAVLLALSVTATSSSDASATAALMLPLSSTQSSAFVAALKAGGLTSTSSAALSTPVFIAAPPGAYSQTQIVPYLRYTYSDTAAPSPPRSTARYAGGIGGAVGGALFGFAILRLVVRLRHQRQQAAAVAGDSQPAPSSSAPLLSPDPFATAPSPPKPIVDAAPPPVEALVEDAAPAKAPEEEEAPPPPVDCST